MPDDVSKVSHSPGVLFSPKSHSFISENNVYPLYTFAVISLFIGLVGVY